MFKKIRVSKGKYTIKRTERKEPRHASVLVWVYNDTNLIIWTCSYICRTRLERVSEVSAVSFLVFIVCHNEETGNTTKKVFCVCVCVFVCVRARVGGM